MFYNPPDSYQPQHVHLLQRLLGYLFPISLVLHSSIVHVLLTHCTLVKNKVSLQNNRSHYEVKKAFVQVGASVRLAQPASLSSPPTERQFKMGRLKNQYQPFTRSNQDDRQGKPLISSKTILLKGQSSQFFNLSIVLLKLFPLCQVKFRSFEGIWLDHMSKALSSTNTQKYVMSTRSKSPLQCLSQI